MSPTPSNTLAEQPRRPAVLVMDGQPLIAQTAYQVLYADCEVLTAADGPTTLALCVKTLPDLVLLDDETPGADGLQLLEQLKAVQTLRQIPVIFIIPHTDSVHETAYLDAGAADFVTKPVNANVLLARVRAHLLLKFQSEQLHVMAFRDRLTGVYSRRYFEEQIGVECARAKRSGSVLSLFVIEIDHCDAYNDYYGHQAGDDALRLIARVLESKLNRPGDIIARYDAQVFACLLPATDFEPSTQLAEHIEQAVRARGIGHASSSAAPVVTVSVGVATGRRAIDGGAEALLRLANEQLCQAKQRGGARVCGKVLHRP